MNPIGNTTGSEYYLAVTLITDPQLDIKINQHVPLYPRPDWFISCLTASGRLRRFADCMAIRQATTEHRIREIKQPRG